MLLVKREKRVSLPSLLNKPPIDSEESLFYVGSHPRPLPFKNFTKVLDEMDS